MTLKLPLKLDLWQTPLQTIDFKGEKEGVQLESSPVYEGIKTQTSICNNSSFMLESSPVYEGIKTVRSLLFTFRVQLESSPVYEGIKTHVYRSD